MTFPSIIWSRFRVCVGSSAAIVMMVTLLTTVSGANAEERANPVVGSLAVGGSVTAGIDEQSGQFEVQVPLGGLPGVGGTGGVSVGLSYAQDAATVGNSQDGLGAWAFGVPQVLLGGGGVRVLSPSGGVFAAATGAGGPGELASGLDGYVQGDLVFSQQVGELPAREGAREVVSYAYVLERLGGVTDYFGSDGFLLARVDAFDHRMDWLWDDGRLVGVVDAAGSALTLKWSDGRVEVISPPRSDGVIAVTVLEMGGNRLVSVTDPVGQKVQFGYNDSGLLAEIVASTGARTVITYKGLPNNHLNNGAQVVDEVRLFDDRTGVELSTRSWSVAGDHNPQGSPTYPSAAQMWAAGDGHYRYTTVLSDGFTRVESTYNSMGLMLSKRIVVSTSVGEFVSQEQSFQYPGTATGGVPDRQQLPEQYTKPTTTQVTFRESNGGTRTVTEHAVFDKSGRVIEHAAADGSVTTTEYDTQARERQLSAGQSLPYGLVVNPGSR